MEIIAEECNNSFHIFITSLNKKDMKIQHEELKLYGIIPFIISKKKDKKDLLKLLNDKPGHKDPIIIHWDESDYGTDIEQQAKEIWDDIIKRDDCYIVFYSATNEEVEYSKFGKKSCFTVDFIPNKSYFGFSNYLDNNLVEEASSLLNEDESVSEHGKNVISYWLSTNKPLAIIRLSGLKNRNIYNALEKYLAENDIYIENVDQGRPFEWGLEESYEKFLDRFSRNKIRTLFIINQTFTRGTEYKAHQHTAFYHDFRKNQSTTGATIRQAAGRMCHYNRCNDNLKLYVDLEEIKRAAGFNNKSTRKQSTRVSSSFENKNKYKRIYVQIPTGITPIKYIEKIFNVKVQLRNTSQQDKANKGTDRNGPYHALTSSAGSTEIVNITKDNRNYKIYKRGYFFDKEHPHFNEENVLAEDLFSKEENKTKKELYGHAVLFEPIENKQLTTETNNKSIFQN